MLITLSVSALNGKLFEGSRKIVKTILFHLFNLFFIISKTVSNRRELEKIIGLGFNCNFEKGTVRQN